ncbi:MAG: cation:proton antiporter [Spirochaetes bacterium]|nr:cation:proton antiporter [Spirochaetota bacterium]
MKIKSRYYSLIIIFLFCAVPLFAEGSGNNSHSTIVGSVGIAILAATAMAYIGHILKQPLLLAYIAAGVIIGPRIGFGLIENFDDIEKISEFGLILLLFLIGLEIDIKKLKQSGKSLVLSGLLQFPVNAAAGIGFFLLLGYAFGGGNYDLVYLAACCSLSSTAIVVKLLYGKFELDTLAGRITLGILVFQDIWAIVLLGIQPNLGNPDVLQIILSFGEGFLLVAVSMLLSRYVLPRIFKSIAKVPELILVSSLGWCFLVCGGAAFFNLSLEMGALIAGVSISTFPYNLDVIAKIVNIRDFFVTLFFVSLGMQIPNPLDNPSLLITVAVATLFLIASRFISIFPVLYSLKNGLRVSLLTPINLSQISEFSLVIASLGVSAGHITHDTMSIIIFIFVITSILSTYMIKYNNFIQKTAAAALKMIGLKEIQSGEEEDNAAPGKEIALLGFYRTASSLLHEILDVQSGNPDIALKDKLVVIDFNPEVHESLQSLGVKVVYGDISHLDTLHHAGIHDVKVVISTIPDTILVGTNNLKIIKHMKDICPYAKVIVNAESIERALKMYAEGADYVFIPRILSATNLMGVIDTILSSRQDEITSIKQKEIEMLKTRYEVIR